MTDLKCSAHADTDTVPVKQQAHQFSVVFLYKPAGFNKTHQIKVFL